MPNFIYTATNSKSLPHPRLNNHFPAHVDAVVRRTCLPLLCRLDACPAPDGERASKRACSRLQSARVLPRTARLQKRKQIFYNFCVKSACNYATCVILYLWRKGVARCICHAANGGWR